jgi:hypothetical protein
MNRSLLNNSIYCELNKVYKDKVKAAPLAADDCQLILHCMALMVLIRQQLLYILRDIFFVGIRNSKGSCRFKMLYGFGVIYTRI